MTSKIKLARKITYILEGNLVSKKEYFYTYEEASQAFTKILEETSGSEYSNVKIQTSLHR
jgi:hypothetical protein